MIAFGTIASSDEFIGGPSSFNRPTMYRWLCFNIDAVEDAGLSVISNGGCIMIYLDHTFCDGSEKNNTNINLTSEQVEVFNLIGKGVGWCEMEI